MTISARVQDLVTTFGDCPALEHDGRSWTWGELGAVGAGVGELVRAAGVSDDAPWAVVLRHQPAAVAAVVSALGQRRCSVLLNPLLADAELAGEIAARPAPVVVATRHDWARPGLAAAAREAGLVAVAVAGSPPALLQPDSPIDPEWGSDLSGVAMTVLSSGTTGRAKRVPVPYSRLDRLGADGPAPDPRSTRGATINSLPLVSIGGALGLASTIWRGRPLAIMDKFDVDVWVGLVRRHRPRRAGGPPAVLRMILDAGVAPDDLAGITSFETGSAPADPALIAEFEASYGIPVLVSYGATEFLAAVTTWTLEDWRAWSPAKRGSVGRPAPGFTVRVTGDDERDLPAGEEGRLEVRRTSDEGSWIPTNDLARVDDDGFVWILGRADDVVIRGGFKVDLDKVRQALERHPAVTEAAVVGLADERVGQVPAAMVAARAELQEAALLAWARAALAPYEVPVRIMVTDALPRNAMLKVATTEIRSMLAAPASAGGRS